MKLKEKILFSVDQKDYDGGMVRYAAYAVSGLAYVFLEPGKKGEVVVSLEPKAAGAAYGKNALEKRFRAELADEKMRSAIADA
ncbi:MAG TPA: hypothetical protein PKI19_06280, partial [Elusimicrobiales bacterium]|nr:hypothetical protein [Elusimicrobiales bacterium]